MVMAYLGLLVESFFLFTLLVSVCVGACFVGSSRGLAGSCLGMLDDVVSVLMQVGLDLRFKLVC